MQRPILRAFPRSDRAFQREVDRICDQLMTATSRSDADPAALEAKLRETYPGATVRPQDPLATFGPSEVVWYVYRRDLAGPVGTDGPDSGESADDGAATVAGPAVDRPDGPGSAPTYSAARAADMVGVPISVLVAWDEAERLVKPARTTGGLALYSRNDLERLLTVKRAFAAGQSVDAVRNAIADETARERRVPAGKPSRRLLVLLAERDPYAAEFSEYFLRTEGYEVEVALNVAEAEAQATELRPDLSIVELLISGGAGPELCARLKSRPGSIVLAISSLQGEDVALRAGADAFLAKPYDALAFVSIVKDLLGESAMLRSTANGGAGS